MSESTSLAPLICLCFSHLYNALMLNRNQILVWTGEISVLVFGLLFFYLGYEYLPITTPVADDLVMKLGFFLKWLSLPALSMVLGVFLVMFQRFTTKAINPIAGVTDTQKMKVFKQYLQNTFEQSLIFLFAQLSLLAVLDPEYIKLIPLFAILFFIGRLLFLIGYLIDPVVWRAPGFALTFYPSVAVLGYVIIFQTFL